MTKLITALALVALSGCAVCQKHETACFVAATLVAGSIVASQHSHNHSFSTGGDYQMSIPLTPDCAKFPEMCK